MERRGNEAVLRCVLQQTNAESQPRMLLLFYALLRRRRRVQAAGMGLSQLRANMESHAVTA